MSALNLAAFVRQQILENNRSLTLDRASFDECHEVISVVRDSPATMLGIGPGDFILRANGRPSALVGPSFDGLKTHPSEYQVMTSDGTRGFGFKSTGIDLGMRVKRTPEAIQKHWKISHGYEELTLLWNDEAWLRLEVLTRPRWTDWFQLYHIGYLFRPIGRYPPVALLYGTTLLEAGDAAKGFEIVKAYIDKHLSDWTSSVTSIAVYYLSQFAFNAGDKEQGEKLLRTAWEIWNHPRIGRAYEAVLNNKPEPDALPWARKPFPIKYKLSNLKADGESISLEKSLQNMPKGSILMVLALLGWRANGPYNDLMRSYIRWKKFFATWLHGVHILTENPGHEDETNPWLGNEGQAQKAKLEVYVLHDTAGVNEALNIRTSPSIFFLDHTGEIVHQSRCATGNDIWEALSIANSKD